MNNAFQKYLNSSSNQIQNQLDQHGVCQLVGIYGIGKSLILDQLSKDSTLPVIRATFKDFKPNSTQQVYRVIVDELIKKKLLESLSHYPQTDFDAHYLIQQALAKSPMTLIIQDAHQLLHLPDSF